MNRSESYWLCFTFGAALAAVTCLPLSVAAPVFASVSTDQTAIQKTYDQINQAFSRHDLNGFMSYFTPDYVDIDEKGAHLTRDQVRRGYRDQLGQIKTIQSRYSILSCTPAPKGYWVEMKMHSSGTGEKRILFAKVKGVFTNDLQVRDLWINTPHGWRLQHRQTLQDDLNTHPR